MKKRRRVLTLGRLVAIMAGIAIAVRVISGLVGVEWFVTLFLAYFIIVTAMGLRMRIARHSLSRDEWFARLFGADEMGLLLMGFFGGVAIMLGIAAAIEDQKYGTAAVLGGMTAGGVALTWLLTRKRRRYKTRAQRRREAARTLNESQAWADE